LELLDLAPLLVWQPVMHAAERPTTAAIVMTRERLLRMADTSSREGEKRRTASTDGGRSLFRVIRNSSVE
jgi:hypothetical protein